VTELANLLPLILLVLAFYLLILRPSRNRQREAQAIQQALAPGQEVVTTAGLYATVAAVEDEFVLLEVAPGVTCRYARPAVARILQRPGESTPPGNPDTTRGGTAGNQNSAADEE
jgi:preprotein translocase subunit YajC